MDGKSESARIKEAIERELRQPYWIRKIEPVIPFLFNHDLICHVFFVSNLRLR